jgi:hypothetical protein
MCQSRRNRLTALNRGLEGLPGARAATTGEDFRGNRRQDGHVFRAFDDVCLERVGQPCAAADARSPGASPGAADHRSDSIDGKRHSEVRPATTSEIQYSSASPDLPIRRLPRNIRRVSQIQNAMSRRLALGRDRVRGSHFHPRLASVARHRPISPPLRLECARHGRAHRSRPAPAPRTPSPGSAAWKEVARL